MNEKALKKRIHNIIPGGAHTYSRGDDQFPSNAPAVLIENYFKNKLISYNRQMKDLYINLDKNFRGFRQT
ncbi:hypothetical protein ES708_21867 [subsurface metagenome]